MSVADQARNFNYCSVCDKRFTGIEPYGQHMVSEKHKKKVKLRAELGINLPVGVGSTAPSGVAAGQSRAVLDMMSNNFYCKACNKNILGNDQYQAHLKGQPHAKKLKTLEQLKEFAKQANMANSDASVASAAHSPLVNMETPSTNMFCSVCKVPVCGMANYNQHINGAAHKKREKEAQVAALVTESPMESIDSTLCKMRLTNNASFDQPDSANVNVAADDSISDDIEEKSVDELRDELQDVLFCPVDQDPMELIRNLSLKRKRSKQDNDALQEPTRQFIKQMRMLVERFPMTD